MDEDMINQICKAVKEADKKYEKLGGGTRNYVSACLLPALKKEGLFIMENSTTIDEWIEQKNAL